MDDTEIDEEGWGLFDDDIDSDFVQWSIFDKSGINPDVHSRENVIELGGSIRFYDVHQMYDLFCNHIENKDHVVLSGKHVDQVDTAGVQLICSLAKTAVEKSIPFTWESASEVIQDKINFLGLNPDMTPV